MSDTITREGSKFTMTKTPAITPEMLTDESKIEEFLVAVRTMPPRSGAIAIQVAARLAVEQAVEKAILLERDMSKWENPCTEIEALKKEIVELERHVSDRNLACNSLLTIAHALATRKP